MVSYLWIGLGLKMGVDRALTPNSSGKGSFSVSRAGLPHKVGPVGLLPQGTAPWGEAPVFPNYRSALGEIW